MSRASHIYNVNALHTCARTRESASMRVKERRENQRVRTTSNEEGGEDEEDEEASRTTLSARVHIHASGCINYPRIIVSRATHVITACKTAKTNAVPTTAKCRKDAVTHPDRRYSCPRVLYVWRVINETRTALSARRGLSRRRPSMRTRSSRLLSSLPYSACNKVADGRIRRLRSFTYTSRGFCESILSGPKNEDFPRCRVSFVFYDIAVIVVTKNCTLKTMREKRSNNY